MEDLKLYYLKKLVQKIKDKNSQMIILYKPWSAYIYKYILIIWSLQDHNILATFHQSMISIFQPFKIKFVIVTLRLIIMINCQYFSIKSHYRRTKISLCIN